MRAKKFEKFIFIGPAIIYLLGFSVFPLVYSVRISLTDLNIARQGTGNFVGLGNYLQLFSQDSLFLKALKNTFLIVILAVTLVRKSEDGNLYDHRCGYLAMDPFCGDAYFCRSVVDFTRTFRCC